jgi:hypothetical protein
MFKGVDKGLRFIQWHAHSNIFLHHTKYSELYKCIGNDKMTHTNTHTHSNEQFFLTTNEFNPL